MRSEVLIPGQSFLRQFAEALETAPGRRMRSAYTSRNDGGNGQGDRDNAARTPKVELPTRG